MHLTLSRSGKLAGAVLGVCLAMASMLGSVRRAAGGEIDFREDFSLSRDRAKALAQLIPELFG